MDSPPIDPRTDPSMDPLKDPLKGSLKELPKVPPKELPKDPPKDLPKDPPKEHPITGCKNNCPLGVPMEAPKEEILPTIEIPKGLKELMSDITRENYLEKRTYTEELLYYHHNSLESRRCHCDMLILHDVQQCVCTALLHDIQRAAHVAQVLRAQPQKLFDFIANYLSSLIITRDHGVISVKILSDLCDCKPTLSEHLLEIGLEKSMVDPMAELIKIEIERVESQKQTEKVRELAILNKILHQMPLDEKTCAQVCQVIRNTYKDFWYRKRILEESLKTTPEEPWEIAAQHTLELYKRTKPSMMELERATVKIQSAYRAYHIRKELLPHLKQKSKRGPKVQPGPPVDVGEAREIDLGPLISIKVNKVDEIEKKLSAPKQVHIPSIKFIPTHNHTPSELHSKIEAERQSIMRNKKSVSLGEDQILVARTDTESSLFPPICRSGLRISFVEASPVVIEDKIVDTISEEIEAESEDLDDEIDLSDDIPEAFSDEVGLGSTATSIIDSMNFSDMEDIAEYEEG